MMKDKRDIRPLLIKLGVAFALSFAGFVYSQLRTKRLRQSSTPPSSPSCSSSGVNKINVGGKVGFKDELRSLPATPSSGDVSIAHENYEDTLHEKVATENTTVGLSPKSTNSKHSGDEEGLLLPEFNDIVHKEFEIPSNSTGVSPKKEVETPTSFRRVTEKETDQEIINLRNMVRVLRERERHLEIQLLEYYGLKEQETAVMELQNRLKINTMEAKLFTLKIESLQADNQRLEAQVADYSRVMAELESARAKIKMLKRKIRTDGEHNKEELSSLKQKVANLQDQEFRAVWNNDPDVQKKLQRLKELEDESAELRKANLRLQRENTELARRLESTQILASSVLEAPETEELKETNHHLREENNELGKEIERLQANRCADVEELVYLRWLNACLRYELRNFQVPSGKTVARDLSKTLSPRSEAKAKQLILEYANSEGIGDKSIGLMDFDFEYWSSSQDSNFTESGDFDDSSIDLSSAHKSHNSSKSKLMSKLKKLVRGKHKQSENRDSSAERASASCAASGRRDSISAGSYEDMVGAYSCSNSSNSATTMEVKTDDPRTKTMPSSQSAIRASLDIQRLRNPSLDDIRDVRRHSDVGSSYGYKRMVLREEGLQLQENRLDEEDADTLEKLELIKFAEALKGSNGSSNPRKRAASYSSF
ncbi:hypothetical protein BVC80_1361g10 [Macleaya cordata]|uniref:Protein CHUP1, chloroplastic n=1 Tax=Macleaya cordata TaxID=56857 RepID=A0A200QVG2_MACCD|nr:hypothetical protein BVC80_1361g10 [Macleaya cordata]